MTINVRAQFGEILEKGNVDAAQKVIKTTTVFDADMAALSLQFIEWMDNNNHFAEVGDPYADRLENLVSGLTTEAGLDVNFEVYKAVGINAFATPDGSVPGMAGLMDLVNDAELMSVIRHEIGHVKLGYSKKKISIRLWHFCGKGCSDAYTDDHNLPRGKPTKH
ncbi:MAG: M48 family metalloprotease [Maribacter sp.]